MKSIFSISPFFLLVFSAPIFAKSLKESQRAPAAVAGDFVCSNFTKVERFKYSGPDSKEVANFCDVSKPFSISPDVQARNFLVCCTFTGKARPDDGMR